MARPTTHTFPQVIRAKNPRVVKFKKYRWMPHSGVALRGRRANYHPDLLTDEEEPPEYEVEAGGAGEDPEAEVKGE